MGAQMGNDPDMEQLQDLEYKDYKYSEEELNDPQEYRYSDEELSGGLQEGKRYKAVLDSGR